MGLRNSVEKLPKRIKIVLMTILGLFLVISSLLMYLYFSIAGLSSNAIDTLDSESFYTASAMDNIGLNTPERVPIYRKELVDEAVLNVLVIGTDIRPYERGWGRADSIILLSYDRYYGSIKFVSILRDIWTNIPYYGWNRINAAHSLGGIGLTVNTINEAFGMDIEYYVVFDFKGFSEIVDDLGGVAIELCEEEREYIRNRTDSIELPEEDGLVQLNGEQALCHCRNRTIGNGDFSRTERQREVLYKLFKQISASKKTIHMTSFVSDLLSHIETNMAPEQIILIGLSILSEDKLSLDEGCIPVDNSWSYEVIDKKSVIKIDLEKNKEWLHFFLYE